jgi:Ca2+/Na+ antiporter
MALSGLILFGMFFFIALFVVIFMFVKHNQYQKDVVGKIKVYILPEGGDPDIRVITKGTSKNWIAIKDDLGNEPHYYYDKENTWKTRYPSDPMFGITWLCVQIDTVFYRKGNPEPVTSHPLAPLVTPESVFAAIDGEFELILKKVSASMLAMEKKLTEALAAHLNKGVVYIAFVVIIIMVSVSLYFSYSAMQNATAVKQAFGAP